MVGGKTVCPSCGYKCKGNFTYCPRCSHVLSTNHSSADGAVSEHNVDNTVCDRDDYYSRVKLPILFLVAYSVVGFVIGIMMVFATMPLLTELYNKHSEGWNEFLRQLGVSSTQELQLFFMLVGIVALISSIFAALTYMAVKRRVKYQIAMLVSLMMAVPWLILLIFIPSGIFKDILIISIVVLAFAILIDISIFTVNHREKM